MSVHLSDVVPWGRRLNEYRAIFALSDADLSGRLLGCGDGPASFNAEASAAGHRVTSVDPIYVHGADAIRTRVQDVFDDMVAQVEANTALFTWGRGVDDLADLTEKRSTAHERFLADFEVGRREGRYIAARLPHLPFAGRAFDLAVCSHVLFLYGEQLSTRFHVESMRALCHVAREVRIFPLLELGSQPSRHLAPVRAELDAAGIDTEVVRVDYEFQRGGNQMLVAARR